MTAVLFNGRVRSLRRRLLLLFSVVTLLIWGLAGLITYHQARHDFQELMDEQMAQTAAVLLAQAAHAPDYMLGFEEEFNGLRGLRKRHSKLSLEFLITHADGRLIARSADSPTAMPANQPGFANTEHLGEPWRSLVLITADGDHQIWVAQSSKMRDKEALEVAAKTILPLGLFIPLLLGLIYFSIRRGLKPLDELATDVSTRSSENLQPLTAMRAPLEVQPLVEALNRLFLRLGTAIDNERRFTADAAHELRTPLAAIRIQAQVALASTEAETHRHALNQVLAGTKRATRLVEQLLRLARLDPLARLPDQNGIDLAALASTLFSEMQAIAPERAGDLKLETGSTPVEIQGDADLLSVVVRNLVENALRYTPEGCPITLFAVREHGEPVLGVRDTGPGVKPEELPKLIERFYRSKETVVEGSGLGLAIVRRIAELHGARLDVQNLDEGGLSVKLRWRARQAERTN